jgi:hypothetical protein
LRVEPLQLRDFRLVFGLRHGSVHFRWSITPQSPLPFQSILPRNDCSRRGESSPRHLENRQIQCTLPISNLCYSTGLLRCGKCRLLSLVNTLCFTLMLGKLKNMRNLHARFGPTPAAERFSG